MADSKIKLKLQQITSFNSGEFSPQMSGRVDLEAFGSSARKIVNFLPTVSGGLKKFYGTAHVDEIDKPREFKMVPFVNRHEPAAFVLHDSKVGFVTSNYYRELNINIPNDIDYERLRWKQINDRVIFVHPERQPFSIDFYGIDQETQEYIFTSSQVVFEEIPYFPIGFKGQYDGELKATKIANDTYKLEIPGGGTRALVGFPAPLDTSSTYTRVNLSSEAGDLTKDSSVSLTSAVARLYKISDGQATVLAEGAAGVTIQENISVNTASSTGYASTIKVTGGRLPTIKIPGSSTGVSVPVVDYKVTEQLLRENVLNAIKVEFPDAFLQENYIVLGDTTGSKFKEGDTLYLQIQTFDCIVDGEVIASGETVAGPQTQVVLNKFEDTKHLIGSKIKIYTNTDKTVYPWYAEEADITVGKIRYSNGSFYKAASEGTCGKTQPSHLSGTASDGKVNWTYMHSGSVSASITAISEDQTSMTVQLQRGASLPILSEGEDTFDNIAWSVWGYKGVHPSDIYFVQNRLGLICNTETFGSWNAMSVSDKLFDFSTEQYGQQLDTSAIVHVITNNPDNKINWVLSYNSLYMGSDTNEFNVSAANDVFTPTSLICNPVSSLGGAAVVPLKYKELNLFVGSNRDELYTIGYDYTIEDYVPKSIGYITNHLLDQGISRLESVHNKDQSVYILHDTGKVSVLNYVGEQSVLAYSEIDAGAEIKDICSTSSKSDRWTYVAVERRRGKYSIEYISDEYPAYMWNTFDYLGDETTEFSLPELAGQDVYIITDDQFIETTIGDDGRYVFNKPTDHYSVGIKMVAELHTQPAFGKKMEGLAQQSVKVSVRLYESGAFSYGDSTDFTKYHKFNKWGTDEEWSTSHNLYTGDALLDLASGHTKMANEGKGPYPNDTGVGINIKASTPEPFNLLSLTEVYV